MKRNKIKILFLLLLLIIGVITLMRVPKNNKVESEQQNINYGSYFDDNMQGEITIYEDGTARYYPDITSVLNCYGKYDIKGNIFTINGNSIFYEFQIEDDSMTLCRYKDYSGEIFDCSDEKKIYTYKPDFKEIIYRADGSYYTNRGHEVFRLGEKGATFLLSLAASSSTNATSGKYSIEENILLLKGDNGDVEFTVDDGKLVLNYYWVSGLYREFAYGEKIFEFRYGGDTANESLEEIEQYNGLKECEHYYNDNYSGEVIIYEGGIARYCPSVNSSVNFCGEYTLENEILTIKEAESVHEFKMQDDELVLVKYVDYQGKIHKFDDEITFTKNMEYVINELRTGTYCNDNNEYLFFDNVGNAGIMLNLENYYDAIQGKYKINDNVILISDDENNTIEFRLQDGKLELVKYSIGESCTEFDSGEKVFEYEYE